MADKLIITYEEYKKVVEKLALEIDLLEPNSLKQITISFENMTLRWICNYEKNLDNNDDKRSPF